MRPISDVGVTDALGPILAVEMDRLNFLELQALSKKLKLKKACGVDEILREYWRVVLEDENH